MGKVVKVGSGHLFCCVMSSCEGGDSNQWLPLQCKLCMNFDDVYFGNNKMFFEVHVQMTFVFISTLQFNIWTLPND